MQITAVMALSRSLELAGEVSMVSAGCDDRNGSDI